MYSKLILLNVILIVILFVTLFGRSSTECLCSIRLRGEYCGSELNRRNGNTDCQNSVYYCGRNNRNKTAVLLAKCNDASECEQNQSRITSRIRRRNPCLQRLQCHCPENMDRGPHCGSQLVGTDCPPNIVFRCRFNRNTVSARDACLEGCSAGKCIGSAVDQNNGSDDNNNSSNDSDSTTDEETDFP